VSWQCEACHPSWALAALHAPPFNIGMHPTANSEALIVNLRGFEVMRAAGDA
jgi:hypothetical protein